MKVIWHTSGALPGEHPWRLSTAFLLEKSLGQFHLLVLGQTLAQSLQQAKLVNDLLRRHPNKTRKCRFGSGSKTVRSLADFSGLNFGLMRPLWTAMERMMTIIGAPLCFDQR